jgi:hypothetical protein
MKAFTGPTFITQFDPFHKSTVKEHAYGQRVETQDGRVFRYAKTGEAITIGALTLSPAINATLVNCAVNAVRAIGATEVAFTNAATTATANEYAEGYAIISYGTGYGQILKVASHAAWTSAQTDASVTLEDPLVTALDATSKIEFTHNPWNGVMMTANSVTVPAGGALIAYDSGDYGWFQTHGVFPGTADGTVTAGYQIMADASTAGDIDLVGTATQQYKVGNAIKATASGYWHPIWLEID